MMRGLACLMVLGLLSGCSSYEPYVASTIPLGTIVHSKGFPSVLRNSRPYILAEESLLYPGDIISTDEQSLLHLQLNSGTTLKLGTRSKLLLSHFVARRNGFDHIFSLSKGAVEVDGPLNAGNHFEIATTIAIIETDGQNFWVGYVAATNSVQVVSQTNQKLVVANNDGFVELNAPLEVTSIIPGAAPQNAITWSAKRFTNARKVYTKATR